MRPTRRDGRVNQLLTTAIVLSRTDFGEADRIVTLLTPDYGKLRLMARGVRKIKSKLAGGIELFSVSDIMFVQGKGEIGTMISARLKTHYGNIIRDIERVQLGYELIKVLHKATEDEPEVDYFNLLQAGFAALDVAIIPLPLIQLWFQAQLLRLGGHTPNLRTDATGKPLVATAAYDFDIEAVAFSVRPDALFGAEHIKLLRLLFSDNSPATLAHVQGTDNLLLDLSPLLQLLMNSYIVRK